MELMSGPETRVVCGRKAYPGVQGGVIVGVGAQEGGGEEVGGPKERKALQKRWIILRAHRRQAGDRWRTSKRSQRRVCWISHGRWGGEWNRERRKTTPRNYCVCAGGWECFRKEYGQKDKIGYILEREVVISTVQDKKSELDPEGEK